MAIAFNTAANLGNNGGTTSSLTTSYTCSAGSLRLLVVGVIGDTITDKITSVTYGGTAMTLIGKLPPGQRWTYLYYLLNPASGANNVVVSASSNIFILAGAADYTGVKQSGQPDASTTQNVAATNSVTTTLTTVADNTWGVLLANGAPSSWASGTNATKRTNDPSFQVWALFDSNAAFTPAGSKSMTFTTVAQGTSVNTIMASFAPDTGGATPLFGRPLLNGISTGGPFFANPLG